jgi:polysaccharide biosynthesis/export protein
MSMRKLVFIFCLLGLIAPAHAQALKTGDTLAISVLQEPKFDRTVVVDPLGEIAFPLAGHFRVQGMTPLAVENMLKSRLRQNYKDGDLDVTVALASAASPDEDLKPRVYVTGEVLKPGYYVVRQPTTLMQAIALAGGLGPYAAKKRIQVRRRDAHGEEATFTFNYKAYEAGTDLSGDIALHAGDIIMVPERGLFD